MLRISPESCNRGLLYLPINRPINPKMSDKFIEAYFTSSLMIVTSHLQLKLP